MFIKTKKQEKVFFMAVEQDDRFLRYNSPNAGSEEIVYEQPGPMDKISEFAPQSNRTQKK